MADKANIRLEPDHQSPVTSTLPQGSILISYEKVENWFRVIITDKTGFVVIGYISSGDVEILNEKISPKKDFWREAFDFSKGINISIKLSMGLNRFSGGDISNGTKGIYDLLNDTISSYGYDEDKQFKSFRIGYDLAADIIYNFTPNIGVGLGSGYFYASHKNATSFIKTILIGNKELLLDAYIDSAPSIKVVPLRLGLFYTLPVHKKYSISVNAGPSLYLVKYSYNINYVCQFLSPSQSATLHQATTKGLGLQGGVGVEIILNPRAVFFIEGQGRYAKITDFEGKIQSRPYQSVGKSSINKAEGLFYYVTGGKYPSLAVFEQNPPMDNTARKAVFDFSGFSLRAGLVVKF